jgi:hypothetical protein
MSHYRAHFGLQSMLGRRIGEVMLSAKSRVRLLVWNLGFKRKDFRGTIGSRK